MFTNENPGIRTKLVKQQYNTSEKSNTTSPIIPHQM